MTADEDGDCGGGGEWNSNPVCMVLLLLLFKAAEGCDCILA